MDCAWCGTVRVVISAWNRGCLVAVIYGCRGVASFVIHVTLPCPMAVVWNWSASRQWKCDAAYFDCDVDEDLQRVVKIIL